MQRKKTKTEDSRFTLHHAMRLPGACWGSTCAQRLLSGQPPLPLPERIRFICRIANAVCKYRLSHGHVCPSNIFLVITAFSFAIKVITAFSFAIKVITAFSFAIKVITAFSFATKR